MRPTPRPPPTALFTVRLWQERVDVDQREWRGEVKQIVSGKTHYFRDWQTLVDQIVQMLADDVNPDQLPGDNEGKTEIGAIR